MGDTQRLRRLGRLGKPRIGPRGGGRRLAVGDVDHPHAVTLLRKPGHGSPAADLHVVRVGADRDHVEFGFVRHSLAPFRLRMTTFRPSSLIRPAAISFSTCGYASSSTWNTRSASESAVSSLKHRHRLLPNDRAVVVLVVDEVNRAACHFRPVVEHRLMNVVAVHPRAAEGGDQRRVDVEHAAGEVVGHGGELQEPRHGNALGPCVAAGAEDGVAVGFVGVEVFALDNLRGDAGALRVLKPARLCGTRHDQDDFDRELVLGHQVDEVLQRPPRPGDQHGKLERPGRVALSHYFTTRTPIWAL